LQPVELVSKVARAENLAGAVLNLEESEPGEPHGVAGIIEKVRPSGRVAL
jgi:hypothetical protein